MRIGSLFSGAGGLDMAVEAVFGGEVIWQSEVDKAASKVLAYRFSGVPNLGDITKANLNAFDQVDVICGGFPCQDVSSAGKRAGIKDGTRSGLWSVFAQVIDNLRPPFVVIENVRGLLSARAHRNLEFANAALGDGADGPVLRAAGAVLGDLSDLGYDAQWTTVAASSVGAPHRRERVFILATDTECQRYERQSKHTCRRESDTAWSCSRCQSEGQSSPSCCGKVEVGTDGVALLPTPRATDPSGGGQHPDKREGHSRQLIDYVLLLPTPTAVQGRNETSGRSNPDSQHHAGTTLHDVVFKGEISSDGLLSTPQARDSKGVPKDGYNTACLPRDIVLCNVSWGKYEPAIRRWESLTVAAPRPTEPGVSGKKRPRLNGQFSEWMMGWPAGWVTDPDIGISRNDQLRIIGNGVCPQQAIAALRFLLSVSEVAA